MSENDIWGEEEQPWWEEEGFIKTLIDKVDFLDILDKYNVEYQKSGSGNSSHKIRCPFPSHLNGEERTPSLHISTKNNLFKCFGCNAGGTVIDFVMLLRGMPRYKAVEEISKITGITKSDLIDYKPVYRNPEHTILPYVYKAGVLIREHLKTITDPKDYYKWNKRTGLWFKKLDYYMLELEDEHWETAKKYYEKIQSFIENSKVVK